MGLKGLQPSSSRLSETWFQADPFYLASLNSANFVLMSSMLENPFTSLNPGHLGQTTASDALKLLVSSSSTSQTPDPLASFHSNGGITTTTGQLTSNCNSSLLSDPSAPSSNPFLNGSGTSNLLTSGFPSLENVIGSKSSLPNPADGESTTNLITNYLPPAMKQEEVRALFATIGEVESCKLVRDKITGQSLCYAFVNFKDPIEASMAVEKLNGAVVGSKKIKVSFARPSSPSIKDANLYVSGIPKGMSAAELERMFSECGQIITSRILADPTTGMSRGVGFIRFDRRDEAELAIKKFDGFILDNFNKEALCVKFANTPTHHSQKALQQAYLSATQRRLASPLSLAASLQTSIKNFRYSPIGNDFSSSMSSININSSGSSQGFCIFVYNLSPDCDEREIWQMFGPLGAVQSVKLIRDENKKCKGFAFVTMLHYDEACNAIQTLNGAPYNNRILQVSFKTPNRKF